MGTYAYSVAGDQTAGYTVTNTHTPRVGNTLFTITYDLNGGTYNGSTEDIKEQYPNGTVISIHAAPVRDGYTFLYWKGSEYLPEDSYTVVGDHTFVAQWDANDTPPSSTSNIPPSSTTSTPPKSVSSNTGDSNNLIVVLQLVLLAAAGTVALAAIRLRRPR